jgi:hypothetical protein
MVGNGVTNIGDSTFWSCYVLQSVFFKGNAPIPGDYVFNNDYNAIVYYLPRTSGWSAWFANQSSLQWNPVAQGSGTSFGVRTNRFGFNITGTADIPIVVEACTNLAGRVWDPLQSCTLTNGSVYFCDSQWTNYPGRFYRIRSP